MRHRWLVHLAHLQTREKNNKHRQWAWLRSVPLKFNFNYLTPAGKILNIQIVVTVLEETYCILIEAGEQFISVIRIIIYIVSCRRTPLGGVQFRSVGDIR